MILLSINNFIIHRDNVDTIMLRSVTLIFMITLLALCEASSQCDCPGNIPSPMMSISAGAVNNSRLMLDAREALIASSYRYINGSSKYENDRKIENTFHLKHHFNLVDISGTYAFSNRLNATIDLLYANSFTEDFYTKNSNNSLSSIISARYNFFSKEKDDECIVSLGGKLPITKPILDTSGASGIYNNSNALYLSLTYNLLIRTNLNLIFNLYKDFNFEQSNGVKQGDATAGNIILKLSNLRNFSPSLALDINYAENNHFRGQKIFSSGYVSAFATTSVSYQLPSWFASAGLSFSYPLYRYYNGYQNAQDFIIQVNFGVLLP